MFVCLLFLFYIVNSRHVLCCQMGDKLTALLILTTLPPSLIQNIIYVLFTETYLLQFFFLFPFFWYVFIIPICIWFHNFFSIAVASVLSFDIFISFLKGLGFKFTVSKGCSETHFLDALFHFVLSLGPHFPAGLHLQYCFYAGAREVIFAIKRRT